MCAISPTGENMRLRKLPVCQNLYSHRASLTLTNTINNNHVKRDHKITMLAFKCFYSPYLIGDYSFPCMSHGHRYEQLNEVSFSKVMCC